MPEMLYAMLCPVALQLPVRAIRRAPGSPVATLALVVFPLIAILLVPRLVPLEVPVLVVWTVLHRVPASEIMLLRPAPVARKQLLVPRMSYGPLELRPLVLSRPQLQWVLEVIDLQPLMNTHYPPLLPIPKLPVFLRVSLSARLTPARCNI